MAGAKKKKKPAANPARGFATTSIASKPRPEVAEDASKGPSNAASNAPPTVKKDQVPPPSTAQGSGADTSSKEKVLSPEEFERQLEESELQLLVEAHSQKVKRDAQRQKTRLQTERRLLRSQADTINIPKWLPPDLMDHILDLIKAESRFASSNMSSDTLNAGKMPAEEDMIIRLWTLQQTLEAAEFPQNRVQAAIRYILDISPNISSAGKDLFWGLEEALDWLARECRADELPAYESRPRPTPKGFSRYPHDATSTRF